MAQGGQFPLSLDNDLRASRRPAWASAFQNAACEPLNANEPKRAATGAPGATGPRSTRHQPTSVVGASQRLCPKFSDLDSEIGLFFRRFRREGDGLENRRLGAFSLRLLSRRTKNPP